MCKLTRSCGMQVCKDKFSEEPSSTESLCRGLRHLRHALNPPRHYTRLCAAPFAYGNASSVQGMPVATLRLRCLNKSAAGPVQCLAGQQASCGSLRASLLGSHRAPKRAESPTDLCASSRPPTSTPIDAALVRYFNLCRQAVLGLEALSLKLCCRRALV